MKTHKIGKLAQKPSGACWAPVLFEPIPGSEERLTIAVAAVNAEGDYRCQATINPKTAKTVFRGECGVVKDIVSVTIANCEAFLGSNRDLNAWEPPLDSVFLGKVQEVDISSLDELISYTAPFASFLYSELSNSQAKRTTDKDFRRWDTQVKSIIVSANTNLEHNFNVRVYLGNHDVPALFTFLSPSFAANLTSLTPGNLKSQLENARAKLWSLHLLADAPNYLFKPEVRELLAGVSVTQDHPKRSLVTEAVEELRDEAERRDITVTQVNSVQTAAQHILDRALAA